MSNILNEAFQALDILEEETFTLTPDGLSDLEKFQSLDDTAETEVIIDPLAETEEDLEDSYMGKAIIDCSVCHSKIYKDPSEIVISENEDLVNVGDICPYCQCSDGYKVIGQVAEFKPETKEDEESEVEVKVDEDQVEVEDKEELDLDEALNIKEDESMKESFEEVEVKTDSDVIKVSSEDDKTKVEVEPNNETVEAEAPAEETIAPLAPETEAEFRSEDDDYEDVEITDIDEESFDELGESYLKKVYENVAGYKTTKGYLSADKQTIKLEGILSFKSGKAVKTNFIFEGKSISKDGKLKLVGSNKQFAKGNKSFTLKCNESKGKLISESLTYNYRAKDAKTGNSKRLYGRVSR